VCIIRHMHSIASPLIRGKRAANFPARGQETRP
jgi:hypothetical protein